jgi:acyl dehydratase
MKHLRDYRVNDSLPVREWYPSDLQIRQFAEASGDFNPAHLDGAWARAKGLDGVVAHGTLTMAQMGAMLTDWMGTEGTLQSFEVRFEDMVCPGKRVLFSGYIMETRPDALICSLKATTANGERVLSGSAVILFKE